LERKRMRPTRCTPVTTKVFLGERDDDEREKSQKAKSVPSPAVSRGEKGWEAARRKREGSARQDRRIVEQKIVLSIPKREDEDNPKQGARREFYHKKKKTLERWSYHEGKE